MPLSAVPSQRQKEVTFLKDGRAEGRRDRLPRRDIFAESGSAGASAADAKNSSLTTCLVIYLSFMIITLACCN